MKFALFVVAAFFVVPSAHAVTILDERIIDASTGKPVSDAVITVGTVVVRGDAAGNFKVDTGPANLNPTILARAPGYRAANFTSSTAARNKNIFALIPFTPTPFTFPSTGSPRSLCARGRSTSSATGVPMPS